MSARKSSGFRDLVVHVFHRLGMERPAEAYIDDVESLNKAATEWHKANSNQPLHFEVPNLLEGALVTGDLCVAETCGICANEHAKAFVRFVDERTGYRCTILMLQIVILIQQAAQETRVNAATGGSA